MSDTHQAMSMLDGDSWTPIKILAVSNLGLSALSVLCALAVLVIIILIRLYDCSLVNRISLRLCAAISGVDVFRSISIILYLHYNIEGPTCIFIAVFLNSTILYHMMLSVCIALNLQLVFLHQLKYRKWWETMYWAIGFGIPTIITLAVGLMDALGLDPVTQVCLYKDVYTPSLKPHLLLWFGFLFWNVLGCIYCLTIAFLTMVNLNTKSRMLEKFKPGSNSFDSNGNIKPGNQQSVSKATISLLIRRVCIYCVIPLITQSGCIIGLIYEEVNGDLPFWLIVWDIIVSHLSGILNLVGFMYDPALHNSLTYIKYDLVVKRAHLRESNNATVEEEVNGPVISNPFMQHYIEGVENNKKELRLIDRFFSAILLEKEKPLPSKSHEGLAIYPTSQLNENNLEIEMKPTSNNSSPLQGTIVIESDLDLQSQTNGHGRSLSTLSSHAPSTYNSSHIQLNPNNNANSSRTRPNHSYFRTVKGL